MWALSFRLLLVIFLAILGSASWAGAEFVRRGAQVGDHWHARYQVVFCGLAFRPFPYTPGNVHTHGDGIIHIHPQSPDDAGSYANVGAFFRSASGQLTSSSLQLLGGLQIRNGQTCPDGRPGRWRLLLNGRLEPAMDRYILQDGDDIRLEYGSE